MKMYMVDPKLMCYLHLAGEHRSIHAIVANINKGKYEQVAGLASKGQIETRSLIPRHEELVREILSRGYKHQTPLEIFQEVDIGEVDKEANLKLLVSTCQKCRARMGPVK